MTAKTAASHVAMDSGDKSDISYKEVWGKLADAYSVGDVVYESANGVWTRQATNAGQLSRTGIVGFNPRVDLTNFGRKDIDDAYAQYDIAPIILSGKNVIVKVIDQNGSLVKGAILELSSSAGSFTTLSTGFPRAELAAALADNDTFALANIGMAKGA